MKKYLLTSAIVFAICLEANAQFHWVQKANFTPGVRYGTISFAIGTSGYVGLGLSSYSPFTYVSDLWEFNPSTNVWTQKANFPGTARHGASSFAIGTKGYVCNGYNSNTGVLSNDLWEYNSANNTWTQKANFIGTARYTCPSFVIGTNAYLGMGKAVSLYNDFYKYDQAANTWTAIANIGGTARQTGSGFSDGTYGYVVGGANGNSYYKDLWKYNPAANTWTQQPYYPGNGSIALTCFFLNGKGYVGCGAFSTVDYRDFYSYNTATNIWSPEASFSAGTRNATASMAIGTKGYAGVGVTGIYPNITSIYQDFWEFSSCSLTDSITAAGSTTFCSGSSVTLNAMPNGAGYTYQWYRSSYPVSGATSSSYAATLLGSYQCLVSQTSTGCVKPTNTITVTVNNIPSGYISAGGSTTFCTGGSVLLTAISSGALSFQWKLNGSNIAGATATTYSATAGGSYTCVYTNNCGSFTTGAVTVTVYSSPPTAVITAGGPITFCSGSSVLLSTGTGTGLTYQWQKNTVNISGATSASYTANLTGNYACIVTNPCGSSTSNVIAVTVNSNPTATITPGGPTSFCTGGSVLLTASSGTGYSYQWKKNGAVIGGATLQNYTANQAGSYTVTVTLGSCSVTSSSVAVYVDQALTPTITGSGFGGFCPSTTVGIETQNGSGYAFQWFEDSHSIPNSNAYQLLTGHNGNFSVNITNGCGTYSSAPYAVTYFDQFGTDHYNVIDYAGSLNICSGGGSVYLFNDGMTYYFQPEFQWYKDGVALPGEVSSGYNATASGVYTCSVRDYIYWCGYGPTVFSNFLVVSTSTGTAPTVSISAGGATSWCGTGSVVLSSSVNTAVSYQWRNNTFNISGATNATYTATGTGYFSCYVTNSCGSATSNSIQVTSQTTPVATINNSGSTTFCQGSQVFLYANSGTGSWTYQWKKNGTNISGATNHYYYANASGSYTVTITNTCGTASSNAIIVTVNTPPTVAISAAGSTTFCAGGSVILNASSTGTTYQWRKTGTNISGATTSSYVVSDSGSYTCYVTNTCGSSNSNVIAVVVNKLPSATITPGGPTTFCDGGSVLLSATVASNRSYQWKKGGINISGATASSYSAAIGGNYKVTVTNNVTGCIKTTAPATLVTVNDLPAATITPQGPTTFCAGGSVLLKGNSGTGFTYQWKKGGNNIAGATAKNYTATLGGVYKINVTNSNGCSRLSSGVLVTVPCKSDGGSESESVIDVKVYPNPSSGDFIFDIKNSNTEKISIRLYDVTGRLIDVDVKQISNFEFQISKLNAGIYSAVISNEENKKVLKLIKTN